MGPSSLKIAVVIPCYRVSTHVAGVIADIPDFVSHIIAVDDACPARSGDVAEATGDPRVIVMRHTSNQGVGGAMVSGYRKALELGCDIVVKIDGDGQMDIGHLDRFVAPLLDGTADYVKGNRFWDFKALRQMPKMRLFGNSVLSFLIKMASGYWSMMDPTNGYTAIHRRVLENLNLNGLAKRYFFESDMLIWLSVIGAVVINLPIPARYGDEESSLSIPRTLIDFPPRIVKGLLRRIVYKYFIYDFNVGSLYMATGLPLLLFGIIFGAWEWIDSIQTGVARSSGTVMLVGLPLMLGFQLLLQAIAVDIASEPRRGSKG